MSKPTLLLLSLILIHTHFPICTGFSVSSLNSPEKSDLDAILGTSKKIGETLEDTEMESEISRRVLVMQKKYISYETLKRDIVPCEKPGVSYYECHAGEAHPYGRGCEVIARCRGY